MTGTEQQAPRSHPRSTPALSALMAGGWATSGVNTSIDESAVGLAARRRVEVASHFPGELLLIPAGSSKIRSNDVTYVFRPHSDFVYLTGLGAEADADSVLVLDVDQAGLAHPVLFVKPSTRPGTEGFYLDSSGEYWLGPKAGMDQLALDLGIEVRDLAELGGTLDSSRPTRLVPEVSRPLEILLAGAGVTADPDRDTELARVVDELRMVKDAWEIEQLKLAIDISERGFADVVRALPLAIATPRGERVVESAFSARARAEGNDIGYGSTAAAGINATTLHWDRCDGPVRAGELVLLDAGAETLSLYTADISRTFPADGTFTDLQRMIYQAVLDAADAAIQEARDGRRFLDPHDAAVAVLARRLRDWGILPVSVEESLSDVGQHHRRWMPHATSHHLGLDVHDCTSARPENLREGTLREGMVITVEPGLYFKADDELVPPEFRGIGVRIEDDILVTRDAPVNLSAGLPRTVDGVENWMASIRGGAL